MQPTRRTALAALLAGLLVLTAVVLQSVLSTVVFAITVAYVLYPLRQLIRERGRSERFAAATATTAGFLGVVALAVPLGYVLYRRRRDLIGFFETLPPRVVVEAGQFAYVVEFSDWFALARTALRDVAFSLAAAAPVIALKLVVFTFLVYGVLLKPHAPRAALLRLCPGEYHDVLFALHRRTATTLRAIYVLQGATAVATFVLAFVTFAALGYDAPFSLAVVAGVLQFVPVLGPSIVVVALAVVDVVAGDAFRAAIVLVVGLILVGFIPDAVIRPRLAGGTTDLPVSVYFVGFVGGLLTLGAIGFVVGPLVVALLAETVRLLSANGDAVTAQQQLPGPAPRDDPSGLAKRLERFVAGDPVADPESVAGDATSADRAGDSAESGSRDSVGDDPTAAGDDSTADGEDEGSDDADATR
ncbi:AI-2E family transporter [Halobaculum sp. CBA1158]|uniref:AI-2E family transporter n=1 Tax=Halobaculum sp. CBA1158 TaxID=2904243 RepID=UPI001F3ACB4B|nr:AI-2E family transporter [Halobaculum sp. CBA1158]UIO99807.1 AI-2E family transporter [Halobaculum sp. CBA1158]